MINWTAIPWDALATFAAGLMAVLAALVVGVRQVGILKQQSEFQREAAGRDLALREIEIKCALLDRRVACISAIREARSSYSAGGLENFRDHTKLYDAIRTAEFTFPENAVAPIRKISDLIYRAETANRVVAAAERRRDEDGRQSALTRLFELEDQIWDAWPQLERLLVAAAKIDL